MKKSVIIGLLFVVIAIIGWLTFVNESAYQAEYNRIHDKKAKMDSINLQIIHDVESIKVVLKTIQLSHDSLIDRQSANEKIDIEIQQELHKINKQLHLIKL